MPNKEQNERLLNAWSARDLAALAGIMSQPDRGFLVQVIWQYGILEQAAPTNPDVCRARIACGKAVGNREDPRFYGRLLYVLEHYRNAVRRVLTAALGVVSWPILQAARTTAPRWKEFFPELAADPDANPSLLLADDIEKLVRAEMERLGMSSAGHPIPCGFVGQLGDVRFEVDGYTGDGRIIPSTATPDDLMSLYERTERQGFVDPFWLDPTTFVAP